MQGTYPNEKYQRLYQLPDRLAVEYSIQQYTRDYVVFNLVHHQPPITPHGAMDGLRSRAQRTRRFCTIAVQVLGERQQG